MLFRSIIGLIMLQQGKGADMGASFGAGASQTLFGSAGSGNALTKATTVLAIAFFCTSLGLAILAKNRSESAGQIDIPIPEMTVTEPMERDDSAPVLDDMPEGDRLPSGDDIPGGDDIPQIDDLGDIPTTD